MRDPTAPHDTFDATTSTWTLRRHATVSDALSCPALVAGHEPVADHAGDSSAALRNAVRGAARETFPATRLIAWRTALESSARARVATFAPGSSVDLWRDVAAPWSLDLALEATHAPADAGPPLAALARAIFLDAAYSETGAPSTAAADAATTLAAALSARSTHMIDVQAFVALSQTLPHLLAAAWHALLSYPDALARWRSLESKAVATDELLRFAGPSRAVFRCARHDVRIGPSSIAAGQRVVLMLYDANRDPLVFPDPDRLDLRRDASPHVAFGGGAHICVGQPIIALALEVATTALLDRVSDAVAIENVQWLDGFAIRAPSSLVVGL